MNKLQLYLSVIVLLTACKKEPAGVSMSSLVYNLPPTTRPLNLMDGYTTNVVTGDSIRPLINAVGDTILSGVPYVIKAKEPRTGYLCKGYKVNVVAPRAKGGVSKFNCRFFTPYTEKEGLATDVVRSLMEDKDGNIWIDTARGVSD